MCLKKSTYTKRIFRNLFFQRILGACARTNDQTSMHVFPRWNDSWVAVILALNLLHLFSFFRKVCVIDVASLLFWEFDQLHIHPTLLSNAWFFFEKVFLKGTSPADHIVSSNTKPCYKLLSIFFFWVFEDLHPCNSYYTIL